MNIAVFCSGHGSNFQAIVDASRKGLFKARVALMVCDNPQAYAIKRAEKEKIKTLIIERNNFSTKQEFEARIIKELEKEKIKLICLAGYMRVLSAGFVKRYRNRILNIHPAILPSFKGTHSIKDALDYGVKVTGVTVHFVNEEVDAGPVILQEAVKVKPDDTQESLAERIHHVEHRLYPEAIRLFAQGRFKIIGRAVRILGATAIFFLVFGFDSKAMVGREAFLPLPIETKVMFYRESLPPLSLKEATLLPETKPDLSAEKDLKLNLTRPDRLELCTPALYGAIEYTGSGQTESLNPSLNAERPLTEEEKEKARIEVSIKIAGAFAELMDSVNAGFAHRGINGLIDMANRVVDFRDYIDRNYNLHFKLDEDQALLKYKRRF